MDFRSHCDKVHAKGKFCQKKEEGYPVRKMHRLMDSNATECALF